MNDNTSVRPSQFDDDLDYSIIEKQKSGGKIGGPNNPVVRHQKTEKKNLESLVNKN